MVCNVKVEEVIMPGDSMTTTTTTTPAKRVLDFYATPAAREPLSPFRSVALDAAGAPSVRSA
jgi:hypothetical protein